MVANFHFSSGRNPDATAAIEKCRCPSKILNDTGVRLDLFTAVSR
jgi:hypothetical protein